MNYFKSVLLFAFALLSLVFIACDKEDDVHIRYIIPEVKVEHDTIIQSTIALSIGKVVFDSAFIEAVYDDRGGIENFSLRVSVIVY